MSNEAAPAVNLEALPPQMRDLVRVIGLTSTLRLIGSNGGTRITVPHKLREHDPIAVLLGLEVFGKLVDEYGGEYLTLPKGDSYLRELRHEQVREFDRQGMHVDDIAEATGYTRRHVFNILGGYADTRDTFTMDLFGEGAQEQTEPLDSQHGKANNPFGITASKRTA